MTENQQAPKAAFWDPPSGRVYPECQWYIYKSHVLCPRWLVFQQLEDGELQFCNLYYKMYLSFPTLMKVKLVVHESPRSTDRHVSDLCSSPLSCLQCNILLPQPLQQLPLPSTITLAYLHLLSAFSYMRNVIRYSFNVWTSVVPCSV